VLKGAITKRGKTSVQEIVHSIRPHGRQEGEFQDKKDGKAKGFWLPKNSEKHNKGKGGKRKRKETRRKKKDKTRTKPRGKSHKKNIGEKVRS